ncbi:MAG: hypothetical protein QM608_11470 [Caulobacter sp.]
MVNVDTFLKYNLPSIPECENIEFDNGAKFISKIDDGAEFSYYHCIYANNNVEELEINKIIGVNIPYDYLEFIEMHDGVSLFCGTVTLNSVFYNISGSPFLRDQSAPSLEGLVEEYSVAERDAWALGWRPIGAISALRLGFLEIHASGAYRVRYGSASQIFSNLTDLLSKIFRVLSGAFSISGPIDATYSDIDFRFSSLLK